MRLCIHRNHNDTVFLISQTTNCKLKRIDLPLLYFLGTLNYSCSFYRILLTRCSPFPSSSFQPIDHRIKLFLRFSVSGKTRYRIPGTRSHDYCLFHGKKVIECNCAFSIKGGNWLFQLARVTRSFVINAIGFWSSNSDRIDPTIIFRELSSLWRWALILADIIGNLWPRDGSEGCLYRNWLIVNRCEIHGLWAGPENRVCIVERC